MIFNDNLIKFKLGYINIHIDFAANSSENIVNYFSHN